jgi:hypothetical protein
MRFMGYCRWSAELNLSAQSKVKKYNKTRAGSEVQYGPRKLGEILQDYLENSNEPLAVAYRERTTDSEKQGWNPNTHLSVDLKTLLRSDSKMKAGKDYQGVLKRDVEIDEFHWDEHFTFVETLPWTSKRNPRVYNGKFISVTRQDDGSLRPNFKPLKIGEDFSLERYALGVYNELSIALGGLVEE